MNIFFDLDGTLIDSKPRLYRLFQQLVVESDLTFDQYWAFKQSKVSNQDILSEQFGYDPAAIGSFVSQWMKLIEHQEFLQLDTPILGVHRALKRFSDSADLHVCTARQLSEPVMLQLDQHDMLKYFSQVMVTHQQYTKDQLIIENVPGYSKTDWFIGDTGHDINIGKKLNLKTCAVTSGFLSYPVLLEYAPDLLLADVTEFKLPTNLQTDAMV